MGKAKTKHFCRLSMEKVITAHKTTGDERHLLLV